MKNIYFETSALMAWLVNESSRSFVINALKNANAILTSSLTFLEAKRGLQRLVAQHDISTAEHLKHLGVLTSVGTEWTTIPITEEICARAADKFPVEPVRSLDAIHLSTILEFLQAFPDLTVLTFDKRIIENLEPLGIPLYPS